MSPNFQKIEDWNIIIMLLFFNIPHIQRIGNFNEIIILLFFYAVDQSLFLSYTLYWVTYFFYGITFSPHFHLHLLYLWMWLFMLSLMLRLILLLVVSEALCASVLTYTILAGQNNKIFGLITQTMKILYGLYCMVFKNMCFWCDTKSKLLSGLNVGINKISCL